MPDDEFERFRLPIPVAESTIGELLAEIDSFGTPTPALAYEPEGDPEPGVTSGHLVIWAGVPGPALMAGAALLVDEDGQAHVVLTSEFAPTTVVDDQGEA